MASVLASNLWIPKYIITSFFLSASSSLASLARASSNSADVTEDTVVVEVVVVEVVVEVVVGIPQLSLAMRNYWFLLWIVWFKCSLEFFSIPWGSLALFPKKFQSFQKFQKFQIFQKFQKFKD